LTSEALGDLMRQRQWLLIKGLETLPLSKALQIAQEAEAFLLGVEPSRIDPAPEQASKHALAVSADSNTLSSQADIADLAAE
jgi:hypothetical protein